ncbi:MAG: T9SS type A sorting domain-containing protein [Saprospiraceae bacterium]
MKTILISLCLLVTLNSKAQEYLNFYLNKTEPKACNTVPEINPRNIKGWEVYSTLDNLSAGEVDTSTCLYFRDTILPPFSNLVAAFDFKQLEPGKAVFIKYKFEEGLDNFGLYSNQLYNLETTVELVNASLSNGSSCNNEVCSGVFMKVQIPDSTGSGFEYRSYNAPFEINNYATAKTCFSSEYFDSQKISELIIKLTPKQNTGSVLLYYANIAIDYSSPTPGFDTILASTEMYNGTLNKYIVPIATQVDCGGCQNYLALHDDSTYPSDNHISYIEADLEQATGDIENIRLLVQDYETLIIQPFTQFRGASIDGSDDNRHNFELVNEGGTFCFPSWIDLVFGGGNNLVYKKGQMDFIDRTSCLQFSTGSSLKVEDNSTLHYGNRGVGMLALRTGANIEIEAGSTLLFDGLMRMFELKNDEEPQDIHMNLRKGATLRFTADAKVTNDYSKDGTMALYVHMLGGTLDDYQLDPASQRLIHRVFPKPDALLSNNIKLLQNPVQTDITIDYQLPVGEWMDWQISNTMGQNVLSDRKLIQNSFDQYQISTLPLNAGMYYLNIRSIGQQMTIPFVKVD